MDRVGFSVLASGLLAMGVFGCGSTGTQRAELAVESAESLRAQFVGLQSQIGKSLQTLKDVAAAKGGDLKPAFDKYVAALDELAGQAAKVVAHSEDLSKRTSQYIKGWEKQMAKVTSPEIREHAAKRRAEAEQKFEDARDELERIRKDWEIFVKTLNEIQLVLENDLNESGVAAMEKLIAGAEEKSKPVLEDIEQIMAGLDRVAATLSSEGGAGEAAKEGEPESEPK